MLYSEWSAARDKIVDDFIKQGVIVHENHLPLLDKKRRAAFWPPIGRENSWLESPMLLGGLQSVIGQGEARLVAIARIFMQHALGDCLVDC